MKIICDWDNCSKIGSYKAPVEKNNSKKYRLLCLEHIKIFNKKWNYFSDMNDQEIEYFIKSDITWHKPTKSFASSENFFNILWNNALEDKLNIFKFSSFNEYKKTQLNSKDRDALDDKLNIFKSSNFKEFKKAKISQTDRDALEVMGLNDKTKWEEIHTKFKTLVKKYHPDKNQGNKEFEDKLKKITLAYSQLKKTLGKKNEY